MFLAVGPSLLSHAAAWVVFGLAALTIVICAPLVVRDELRLRKTANEMEPFGRPLTEIEKKVVESLEKLHESDLAAERANMRELRDMLARMENRLVPLVQLAGAKTIDGKILTEIKTSFATIPTYIPEPERAKLLGITIKGILDSYQEGMDKLDEWKQFFTQLREASSRVTDSQLMMQLNNYRVLLESDSHFLLWNCYEQHQLDYQNSSIREKKATENAIWAMSDSPIRKTALTKVNKRIKELLK